MFGTVPKSIWQKTNPADENNMCSWSLRCLLIEDGKSLILVDAGIGTKQSEKFFSHYYLHGVGNLDKSLNSLGFSRDDITDVFLTHLHFDHCGGAVAQTTDGKLYPAFKNATFWGNKRHWKWATEPNPREKASFLGENMLPLKESGQLKFIDRTGDLSTSVFPNIDVIFVDGHTDSMMLPLIHYKGKKICFMADLLPSVGHIPLAYVMGYDTRPLITLAEKDQFLKRATSEEFILYFEHDYTNECCSLKATDKGARCDEIFSLKEIK